MQLIGENWNLSWIKEAKVEENCAAEKLTVGFPSLSLINFWSINICFELKWSRHRTRSNEKCFSGRGCSQKLHPDTFFPERGGFFSRGGENIFDVGGEPIDFIF